MLISLPHRVTLAGERTADYRRAVKWTSWSSIEDLVSCEASFRPPLDGSLNSFRLNVEDVLASIYGCRLDLQNDILAPAARANKHPVAPEPGTVARMIDEL